VPSQLNIPVWRKHLEGHPDSTLVDLLEYGFPIGYSSEKGPAAILQNHKGATSFPDDINSYLSTEISDAHILGPFSHNPLITPIMVSPLNSVPKKDSMSRRIISDLSFPPTFSVNDGIAKNMYLNQEIDLTYPSVDTLASRIKELGPTCLIFKKDLAKAYRQFAIDPGDIHLLGYVWQDSIFLDLALAMGIRSAAFLCQRVTNSISFMCTGFNVINYLDDIACVSPGVDAHSHYSSLTELFISLGLKESVDKAIPPTHELEFLGILFNVKTQTMSITKARLTEIHTLLDCWLGKKSATKRELQSLIGKLQFISKCILFSRIFISRLLLVLPKLRHQNHKFRPSSQFKKDIIWWKTFVTSFNGVTLLPHSTWSDPDAVLSTDAGLSRGGGWIKGHYFACKFPECVLDRGHHINILELLSIMVALKLWVSKLAYLRVTIYCDNTASVATINSGRTRDAFMLKILREIAMLCASQNCQIRAVHLPGTDNRLADQLSRAHLEGKNPQHLVDQSWARAVVADDLFDFDSRW